MSSDIPAAFKNANWDYKLLNGQYVLTCPCCGKEDKMHICIDTGQAICFSGACGFNGNMITLNQRFPELAYHSDDWIQKPEQSITPASEKTYLNPVCVPLPLDENELQWFDSRSIRREMVKKCGIFKDGSKSHSSKAHSVVFPFYQNGKIIMWKARPIEPNKKKEISSSGTKQIFFNMDNVDKTEPLFLTEGMIDLMSLMTAGINNVISIPSGTNALQCFTNCWDWITSFPKIIICMDGDKAGEIATRKIIEKLEGKIQEITFIKSYPMGCYDLNDVLVKYGNEGIIQATNKAIQHTLSAAVEACDISARPESVETADSLFYPLKIAINGYESGALTVWSGGSGCGKSLVLFNELGAALRDGKIVCINSGEFNPTKIKQNTYKPLANKSDLEDIDLTFRIDTCITKKAEKRIDQKYGHQLLIVREQNIKIDKLMEVFKSAYKKYGATVFIIDNLMSVDISTLSKYDFNHDQTEAMKKITTFIQNHNVHVHLVAHNSKNQAVDAKDRVSGSKNITNMAWNIIEVVRNYRPEKEKLFDERKKSNQIKAEKNHENVSKFIPDGFLNVWKNRQYGDEPHKIAFNVSPESKRISWVNYSVFGSDGLYFPSEQFFMQDAFYGINRDMMQAVPKDFNLAFMKDDRNKLKQIAKESLRVMKQPANGKDMAPAKPRAVEDIDDIIFDHQINKEN